MTSDEEKEKEEENQKVGGKVKEEEEKEEKPNGKLRQKDEEEGREVRTRCAFQPQEKMFSNVSCMEMMTQNKK